MIYKHYYYFDERISRKMKGNSLNEQNWNVLRDDEVEGPFAIENTIELYEQNCVKQKSYSDVANIIVNILKEYEIDNNKLISLGAGKGILEWNIKKMCPELVVECTDYAAKAIDKLKTVFKNVDNAYTFDMINGNYCTLGIKSTLVLYRVSTEFSFDQWNTIFLKMHSAGIENIIFVPTELGGGGNDDK